MIAWTGHHLDILLRISDQLIGFLITPMESMDSILTKARVQGASDWTATARLVHGIRLQPQMSSKILGK